MVRAVLVLVFVTTLAGSAEAPAEAHYRRASKLASQGDLRAAEQEYLTGLAISPDPAAYNNLGVLYFQKQDFEHAAAAFGQARKWHPSDPEIAFNLGLALYKAGKASDAIPALEMATASSHAVDAHYLLGACYFARQDWKKSIAELERFRVSGANRPETLFILARAYRYNGQPAASLDAAAQLLKSNPDSQFTHELLAEGYDKDGQPDKAIEEFQKAIVISPQAPELHFMLGYVCWRWKRYEQAIAPLQEELHINPSYAAAHYYLGDIALRRTEYDKAIREFNDALRLDPSYSEAALGLGKLYLKTGRLQEAIASLEKAKNDLGASPELHYSLGRALIQAGRDGEGRAELTRVSELHKTQNRQMEELLNGVPVGERPPPAVRP